MTGSKNFILALAILLGVAIHCWAQGGGVVTLEPSFVNVVPFCSNTTEPPPGNTTGPYKRQTTTQVCSEVQAPLNSKTLANDNQELVALQDGKGIAFYRVNSETHTTTLVAQYQANCSNLIVVGLFDNTILVCSSQADQAGEQCPALGLGTIDLAQLNLGSSGNATGGGNTTGTNVVQVQVVANTNYFSYAETIILSNDQQGSGSTGNAETQDTLVVVGATNGTGNQQDSQGLVLKINRGGSSSGNATSGLAFQVLFQGQFPFNLIPESTVLFSKATGQQIWIVGPTASGGAGGGAGVQTSDTIAIWALYGQGNATAGNGTTGAEASVAPKLIASIPVNQGKLVAVSVDGNALYLAQQGNASAGGSENATSADVLSIFDVTTVATPKLVTDVTYEQMKAAVADGSGNTTSSGSNATVLAVKITAITASARLWIGCSTGELFVHDIASPVNPTLQAYANVFSFSEQGTGSAGGNSTSSGSSSTLAATQGINDIDPTDETRAFVTATDVSQPNGKLFLGVQFPEAA